MAFIARYIWWIIGILFIVSIGTTWALFATGYIYRIKDWFKPASDRFIPGKIFYEDKQIRDRRLVIGRYVISDMKRHRSFYLVHDLLMSYPRGGGQFLALSERSARPIDFHGRITKEQWAKYPSARQVFIDTTADIRSESSKEATNNFMAQSLAIIALCAAVVVVIFGAILFYQSRLAGG